MACARNYRYYDLVAFGLAWCLLLVTSSEAFGSTTGIQHQPAKLQLTSSLFSAASDAEPRQPWLDKGLLLSSFTDGLQSNPQAQDWLCDALVENLWKEEQQSIETSLSNSNEFIPCNGPDIATWEQLESIDKTMQELYFKDTVSSGKSTAVITSSHSWRQSLELLQQQQSTVTEQPLELRIVYIPTALYAPRMDSHNTPGKQRQRARVDGKKRRDAFVQMLKERLIDYDNTDDNNTDDDKTIVISTVTLDFEDGSVKQAESTTTTSSDNVQFPKSGREAMRDWQPHLIHVQGGNTFWLHHCMEKGHWGDTLIEACCSCRNDFDEKQQHQKQRRRAFKAVYIGVSADSIMVGHSMQTACWKVRAKI
jgi:hypothetical protein